MSELSHNSNRQPAIRFKGFTDPWEQRKLGDYLSIPKKEKINIINSSDLMTLKLNLGGIIQGTNRETLELGATNYYKRKAGQFLYGKQNFFNGSMAIIPESLDGKATSGDVPSLDISNIDSDYLFTYVSRQDYWRSKEAKASGTGSKRIHEAMLLSFNIKVPEAREQQIIAALFNHLNNLIALHQRKVEVLQNLKKALLQRMFASKDNPIPDIRFAGFTDPWEQRKLGKLYKTYSGMTPLRSDFSNFENPTVPWIKTTDLRNTIIRSNEEKISDKAASKLRLLPVNTVLIAMYGGFNQIGRTGLLTYPSTINQALTALEPIEEITSYFLITELNYRVNDWKRLAASSRKDPNITKSDVENFRFFYPLIEEQQKIGSFFKHLDHLIALHQRKVKVLQDLKKALLQKMFI